MAVNTMGSVAVLLLSLVMLVKANPPENMRTKGGNGNGCTCVFPFFYNDEYHFDCLQEYPDDEYSMWCACVEVYDSSQKPWGYCKYEECRRTFVGWDYVGQQTINDENNKCDLWEDYVTLEDLPDDTWEEAGGHCRNPGKYEDGMWCYVEGGSWDYCNEVVKDCNYCDKKLASGENSKVGTGDYVASSNRDAGHPPGKAELNSNKAWCALTNDDQQWVQVMLPEKTRVYFVVTQGAAHEESWLLTYKLAYSLDGTNWIVFTENGTERIFEGNFDRDIQQGHTLPYAIFGQWFRILPLTFLNNVCVRFDFVGCVDQHDCEDVVCQNGGTCDDHYKDGYHCLCTPEYTGEFCESVYTSCSSEPCYNGATCTPYPDWTYQCTCQVGYNGVHCEQGSYGTCMDVANAGITDSAVYRLKLYSDVLPNDCRLIEKSLGLQKRDKIINRFVQYSRDMTVENCHYLCMGDEKCKSVAYSGPRDECVVYHELLPTVYHSQYNYSVKYCVEEQDIYCELSDPARPVTYIDTINTTDVHAHNISKPRPMSTSYTVSLDQVEKLMENSVNCEQYMKVDCNLVVMARWGWSSYPPANHTMHDHYADCLCGLDNACAIGLTDECVCDANDEVWRMDNGTIVGKHKLPVIGVITEDTDDEKEQAYFSLGPLMCAQEKTDGSQCQSNPCSNGGTCIEGTYGYTCQCQPTYSGTECQTTIDGCLSDPCLNEGTCTSDAGGFTCTCETGWTGVRCNTDVVDCPTDICKNGGSCVDELNSFYCLCARGFQGDVCEEEVNECMESPCENEGSCEDLPGGYECTCQAGYTGLSCEYDINECESQPCMNGGTCHDAVGDYTCECANGKGNKNCDGELNECDSSPCVHGECLDKVDHYECLCEMGYTGINCETDINECGSTPCRNGGSCDDELGNFKCNCELGYTGDLCEAEIEECQSMPCRNGGTCKDLVGSYTCECVPGYTDQQCETDIDECLETPCENEGTCNEGLNKFTCTCYSGYSGETCSERVVDGAWGGWKEWSACSEQCGLGVTSRSRDCNNPSPQHGGEECNWDDKTESKLCDGSNCENVGSEWGAWTDWSSCSKSCGQGTKVKERKCEDPGNTKQPCEGNATLTESCSYMQCGEKSVDGHWSAWSMWTSCSQTCGVGTSRRQRLCDNPPPAYGGKECPGGLKECEAIPCQDQKCPVYKDCDDWQQWSAASKTCGDATRSRSRVCRMSAESQNDPDSSSEITEYEHAHHQEKPCGGVECYHCNSTYDGSPDSLQCRGPTKACPSHQEYCIHQFDKDATIPGVNKQCATKQQCDEKITEVCRRLQDAAVDSVLSFEPEERFPLEPHEATLLQLWVDMDSSCHVCCKHSRCNRGSIPAGNTILTASSAQNLNPYGGTIPLFYSVTLLISYHCTVFCARLM